MNLFVADRCGLTVRRGMRVFGIAVGIAVLSGCYGEDEMTIHEPGVYQGKHDPLLDTPVAERAESLQARFMDIQTDR